MNYLKRVLLVIVILIYMSDCEVSHAGFIRGDEALGGFSYMMECAYANELPSEPYLSFYYQAYMMFHYDYIVSDEERAILERIVEAEATGGNVEQKMNVASCILARVESNKWPNTITDVVFDYANGVWQFSPLDDGRYYTVNITNSTKRAVENVLKWGKTHDCLWFCSDGSYNKKNAKGEYCSYHRLNHTHVFFDGEHHYFYD